VSVDATDVQVVVLVIATLGRWLDHSPWLENSKDKRKTESDPDRTCRCSKSTVAIRARSSVTGWRDQLETDCGHQLESFSPIPPGKTNHAATFPPEQFSLDNAPGSLDFR
jgi:hypothetical protein